MRASHHNKEPRTFEKCFRESLTVKNQETDSHRPKLRKKPPPPDKKTVYRLFFGGSPLSQTSQPVFPELVVGNSGADDGNQFTSSSTRWHHRRIRCPSRDPQYLHATRNRNLQKKITEGAVVRDEVGDPIVGGYTGR